MLKAFQISSNETLEPVFNSAEILMMGVSRSKSYPVDKGCQFVGNKTKGQISKQVLQENKARQILRKMNISYPLTHACACQ